MNELAVNKHLLNLLNKRNELAAKEHLLNERNELAVNEHLLNKRYFVEVEEFVKTTNNYWLVMTFCNGGTLSELITHFRGTLEAKNLRSIMR